MSTVLAIPLSLAAYCCQSSSATCLPGLITAQRKQREWSPSCTLFIISWSLCPYRVCNPWHLFSFVSHGSPESPKQKVLLNTQAQARGHQTAHFTRRRRALDLVMHSLPWTTGSIKHAWVERQQEMKRSDVVQKPAEDLNPLNSS